MKREMIVCAVLAAGMTMDGSAAEVPTFSNPIGEDEAADPFVTYDAALDWYYCLHTEGTAVRIRRSRRPERLLADNDVKTVFETNAVAGVYRHLWAPEMHRAPNGRWYVYTSGDTTPGREWTLRLVCLESETSDPFDGFRFKSFPLPGVQAIDPTVHWTSDGRGYLACARMDGGGEHLAIYELANPWTCRGAGVEIARPTLPWEKKAGRILEGPFFVKGDGDGLFMVYSANDTRSEHYALGALAFDGKDLMSAASWHKRKEPVLFKANGVYGPGHASFFRTRGGELWCAYHGMDGGDGAGGPTAKTRRMHLQPADPDDDGCPHLAGAWGRGPHRVPDAPKETLPPLPAGAFSYVVIPDTQRYRGAGSWSGSSQPTSNPAFESRVNWIVRHAKDQNIAFVSHVGDITDRNNAPQYQFASNLMSRLDGVVPWRTAAGNHDMVPKTGDTANFERWFGSPNRVDLFEAGGMKFVVVTLVCNAPEPVMRWADEQLEKYADRLAIVCTHAYLGPRDPSDRWQYACREPSTRHYELRIPDERLGRMPWLSAFGEYSTANGVGNTGETMWRNHLSKHKNLLLVVCGDQSAVVSQHLADTGAHGNVVHAFLQDYPRDNDRTDPVRVFRFLPAERRVEVFTVMAGEDVLCTRAKFLEEHHRFTFGLEGTAAAKEPNAVFGVLADVHLVPADAKSVGKFKQTLRYLDSRKVDGVVICGDLTHRGSIPSLMGFGRVWREVFPGDRRSDGGHVERLFVYGDHETENMYCAVYTNAWTREGCMEEMRMLDINANDRALQWKRAFGDDYHPIERKRVKGYDFVLAHIVMGDEPGLRWGEPLYIPGLEEFFATNTFDRTRPFFYVQHKIPRGTVGGEKIWGQDDGRTTKLLSKYPNAVAFCGHKHRNATEERLFWQGAFTAFMVPAHMGVGTEEGHENGVCSGDRPSHTPQLQMPRIDTRDGSQGFVMSLYDDRIVIERREFAKGGEVAPPWVVSVPNDGSMSFEARAARAAVPQFAKGAEVTVCEIRGKNRSGRATDQLSVEFPPVCGGGGLPRAYDYEVTAILKKAYVRRIVGSKRVFSPKCHLAPENDTGPVVCLFGKEELPSDHDTLEFEVVPANAFGARGEPIRSKPRSFNPTPCATTLW